MSIAPNEQTYIIAWKILRNKFLILKFLPKLN